MRKADSLTGQAIRAGLDRAVDPLERHRLPAIVEHSHHAARLVLVGLR